MCYVKTSSQYRVLRRIDSRGENQQMSTTHAMTDSNDRTGHLITLQVDKIEKISGMIEPAGCGMVRGISNEINISDRITYGHSPDGPR